MFLSLNFNRFNSPGGVITDPTVGNYGLQTLANAYVHTFQATVGWTHYVFLKAAERIPRGHVARQRKRDADRVAPNTPTVILDSPAAFTSGQRAFLGGKVFERQYSLADRIDYVIGKHTLQFGFDFNRARDADTEDGGADPNEAVDFGSPLGLYEFPNLQTFALGEYINFSQAAGARRFPSPCPYYGFYVQDTYRALPQFDARNGLARGLPGLPAARGKSCLPAHRPVSQPVSTPGAALRICLATRVEDGSARRIRHVLYQHERAELPQRRDLERPAIAAV
jgi:hypothetical protein